MQDTKAFFCAAMVALAWSLPTTGHAAPAMSEQLDAYFGALAAAREFNGTVLVRRGDEVLYARAFAMGGSGTDAGPGLETPLAIASLTKTFTSGAVLGLINAGQIALDDPVSRFLPDFPNGGAITVRHLLTHSGGLDNPDVAAIGDRRLSSAELVAQIAARPPLFAPGSDNRYSNAGYNLLARIVEIASGRAYPVYLEERFWDPLGMRHTFDGGNPPRDAPVPAGYIPGPKGPLPVKAMNYTAALGAGSVFASAPDLGRWLMAVADRRFFDIFDKEWPYGWGKTSVLGHEGVEQTGAVTGFVSVMHVYPQEHLAVVALSSIENGSWSKWGRDIATIAFGGSAKPPVTPPAQPLPDDIRTSALGTYRGDGWTAHIRDEDGFLWAYWNDFPTGKYLKYIGDTEFAVPSDIGRIRFLSPEAGAYQNMEWAFPGGDKLSLSRVHPADSDDIR